MTGTSKKLPQALNKSIWLRDLTKAVHGLVEEFTVLYNLELVRGKARHTY